MKRAELVLPLSLALALLTPAGVARADDPPTDASTAAAATTVEEVTLEALLERVAQSPRVRIERALAEANAGDVRTAGQHPNPVLSYTFAGFLGGIETNGGSQQEIRFTQPFLWPGQLDARVRAAQAELERERASIDILRGQLSLEVRRAFVALLAAQERTAILDEFLGRMEALAEIVRGRAEAGAGRRWDVTRLDGELAALRAERDAARSEEVVAAGRIGVLLGQPSWFPRAAGSMRDLDAPDAGADVTSEHPALRAASLARQAAVARLEAERALALPPIELSIGTIVSTAPEGGYLVGGVAMPLPFFDANQGQIQRAEREAEAAELTGHLVQQELRGALERARRALAHRREALAAFEQGALERLPELTEMADVAYRGGEISVFELLDAVHAARELRLQHVERAQTVREAEIDLLEAVFGAVRDSTSSR